MINFINFKKNNTNNSALTSSRLTSQLSIFMISLIVCSTLLTGCGLTQSITDGTKEVAKDIFYKRIKTLKLDFEARSDINSDDNAEPLSVVVRVYQLKDNKLFEQSDYQTLMLTDNELLKQDMVSRREFTIRPQGMSSLNLPMENDTNYVGIFALFREPNKANSSWRIVLERNDLDADDPTGIELTNNQLRLIQQEEKIVHIEEIVEKADETLK